MTNFEYYVKGGRFKNEESWAEAWAEFLKFNESASDKERTGRAIDRYNRWLLAEHKEPILDDIEKEYLSNIIKPFKDTVLCITKDVSYNMARIRIAYRNGSSTCLPWFLKEKMYVNMLGNTYYTLKELNL